MLKELNQLMDHIERHLTEELSGTDIVRITGVSEYHFRRMFSYMSGMTLNEYIRNRRLSQANINLVNQHSVTEVAYEYGYQSIEGFSRAFREWSGFLPSEVIKNKIQKSFPRFTFYIDIKGGVSMEFKIERKSQFHVVGVSKRVPIQFEGVNHSIMELAQSITPQQRQEMQQLADLYPETVLNVSFDFDEGYLEEQGSLTHMIGFATSRQNPYGDLEQITIEDSLWAVFPNTGPFPQTLQETMAKTYAEWLPTSGYELVDFPSISFTIHKDDSLNVYSEVWVAVKEKTTS